MNFEVKIVRLGRINNDDSCVVTVRVSSKFAKKSVQTIIYNSTHLSGEAFTDCNFVRSYITNINKNIEASDYDFGDLIIADLNFDGKEDFAVKNDSGGNGGPYYNFYIQGRNGHFAIDNFLTNFVSSFPKYISKSKKTLSTQIHANAYEECKNVYHLDTSKNTWKRIKKTFIKL